MISYQDCDPILSWEGLVEAIQLGHKRKKAEIKPIVVIVVLAVVLAVVLQ